MKNILKESRLEKGLTQEQLAEKSQVARTIISELEMQKTKAIKNTTMEKISKALNKTVPEIFFQD